MWRAAVRASDSWIVCPSRRVMTLFYAACATILRKRPPVPCRTWESTIGLGARARSMERFWSIWTRTGCLICFRNEPPQSQQIADRFHLVLNLSATMERVLEERSRKLILPPVNDAAAEAQLAAPGEASANIQAPLPGPTQSELRRQRRLARYEEVVALFQSGHSQAGISKALGLQRKTIRRWLRGGEFPERKPPHRPPPKVNEFGAYLEQRWNEGCHNATVLYQEIRDKGYRGRRSMVARFVASWRNTGKDHTAERSREDFAKTCRHSRHPRSRPDYGRATARL